jgi:pimeloyl-ACP methyl ester carboxylesterase
MLGPLSENASHEKLRLPCDRESGAFWSPLVRALKDLFDVIMPDSRSHGGSDSRARLSATTSETPARRQRNPRTVLAGGKQTLRQLGAEQMPLIETRNGASHDQAHIRNASAC